MSGIEKEFEDVTFWGTVKANNFHEDVLVPALSHYQGVQSMVQNTLRALSIFDDEMVEQDCRAAAEQQLTRAFGLPPELSDKLFEQCQQHINWAEPRK